MESGYAGIYGACAINDLVRLAVQELGAGERARPQLPFAVGCKPGRVVP